MEQQTRSRIADSLDRARLLVATSLLRDGWVARRTAGDAASEGDGLPLPPPRLRLLVDGRSADAGQFLRIGGQMHDSILAAVGNAGREIEAMERVLDFGCGCGRVARHWAGVEGPELHGCDYNGELLAWCDANLPFLSTLGNELAPPTPYPSQSFDLVYALSVLSHLSDRLQRAWVAEFHRILRPGGLLLVSVLGEQVKDRLSPQERERFDSGEALVQRSRLSGRNLCTAYHPRPYVKGKLLAEFADVRLFNLGSPALPVRQDAYLARR